MNTQEISEFLDDNRPGWVEPDYFTDLQSLRDLLRGGCASGYYMPAVRYRDALKTMHDSGDAILDWLADMGVNVTELLREGADESWSGLACHVLSAAVETWCADMQYQLETMECDECCGELVEQDDGSLHCEDCAEVAAKQAKLDAYEAACDDKCKEMREER